MIGVTLLINSGLGWDDSLGFVQAQAHVSRSARQELAGS